MMNTHALAHTAALMGEPARTAMLLALMDGRALTATELSRVASVAPPTASRHLALLAEAGLLVVSVQGRHRYHRLASAEVAHVLEGMLQLTAYGTQNASPLPVGPRDEALRIARTCYDHLAGRLGVCITQHLEDEGAIVFDDEQSGRVMEQAPAILQTLGLNISASDLSPTGRRVVCRPCLDWSERRPHVAGRLGVLLYKKYLEAGWLRQGNVPRALAITPGGAVALRNGLGLERWNAVVDQS